jgi:transcriptional regulator with XRE-family HTH domain
MLIHNARVERRMSIEELAERADVSRGLVYRAEAGDPGCSIGAVFELASIVGVRLFDAEPAALALHLAHAEKTLALLPRAARRSKTEVQDDF